MTPEQMEEKLKGTTCTIEELIELEDYVRQRTLRALERWESDGGNVKANP